MKIEKLKENSLDEIISFVSNNKNLVIGNNNIFTNDFKNLLLRFASSRNKVSSELLCYALRDENRELNSAIVFNFKGEISVFCIKDLTNFDTGKELLERLKEVIDINKISELFAKVSDDHIGDFNRIGFKSVRFYSTMDDANTYSNYYFLLRYRFNNVSE